MSSPLGIIVDGEGDFASLRRRFREGVRVVKTDGPRGHQTPVGDIVTRSRKQISILQGYRCREAIVMLDHESRQQDYKSFVQDLQAAFSAADLGIPVHVAVPNRMIENWYLADIEHLSVRKAFLRKGLRQKRYEGSDGKAHIKRCMKPGHSYRETKHGPEMFAILRFPVARKNSPSFDRLLKLMRRR